MRGLLVVALCLLMPGVAAMPEDGTEERPELVDAPNDVVYDPAYTGTRHAYLDVIAAWIEYLPGNDTFMVTLKSVDATGFTTAPGDVWVRCGLSAGVFIEDDYNGVISFYFQRWPVTYASPEPRFEARAEHVSEGDVATPVRFGFQLDEGAPGYGKFWVERARLQAAGTDLRDFHASCWESSQPMGIAPLYRNQDDGQGQEPFHLAAFRPPATETEAPETFTSDSAVTMTTGDTPGLGLALALLAVCAVALARRK